MKTKKILITGASVGGNTVAWWLTRQNFDVTVVEKAENFREGGQNVDVRGSGREVLRRMGLEQKALDLTTGEKGTDWVDEKNTVIARFAVEDIGDGPTAELEIMRGDISRIIYDATKDRAKFRFGDSIETVEENGTGSKITFKSGIVECFDIVIIAEGVGSSTRELLFTNEYHSRYMDLTIAYFAIPGREGDGQFSRQYNTIGGRGATLKPGSDGKLRVYMGIHKLSENEHKWDAERQKKFLKEKFAHDQWEFPRILKELDKVKDFYFDVMRQVKMNRWSKGNVVLTGDAAWCATPLSGIGTTLAIVGGYVLAGEITKANDLKSAFVAYDRIMRPFVKEGQGLPKIAVRLLWPHRRFGLLFLRAVMRLAGTRLFRKIFSKSYLRNSEKVKLPTYKLTS